VGFFKLLLPQLLEVNRGFFAVVRAVGRFIVAPVTQVYRQSELLAFLAIAAAEDVMTLNPVSPATDVAPS